MIIYTDQELVSLDSVSGSSSQVQPVVAHVAPLIAVFEVLAIVVLTLIQIVML